LAVLGYLAGALVLTWPLVTDMGGQVTEGGDSWQEVWSFWWLRTALLDWQTNPFHTSLLHWPQGAALYLNNNAADAGLLLLPVIALAGPVVAFNLASLGTLVATGYALYRLALLLTGHPGAAFLAGWALTFNPWHVYRLGGQLNLAALHWPILAVWLLARPTAHPGRTTLLAAAMLVLTWLSSPYLALYTAVLLGLWAVNRGLDRGTPVAARRAALARLGGAGLIAGIVLAPLLAATWSAGRGGEFITPPLAESLTFSADPLSYLLPAPDNTLGRLLAPGVFPALYNGVWGTIPTEQSIGPGLVLGLGGLIGLILAWPRTRLWINVALVAGVLSLGPILHVAGQGLPVPLPYLLLYLIPGMEVGRTPIRFAVLVQVALSVGLAYGLAAGAAALRRGVPRRGLALAGTGVLAALVAEQAIVPLAMETSAVPPLYHALAAAPPGAILEIPAGDPPDVRQSRYLLHQMVHGRPLVGGYIARQPHDPLLESPALAPFRSAPPAPDVVTGLGADTAAARLLLQESGVTTLILHKAALPGDLWTAPDAAAAAISGAPPLTDTADLRAYTVPAAGDPAALGLLFGRGWDRPTGDPPARWVDPDAVFWLVAAQPQTVTLQLQAAGAGGAREIVLTGPAGLLARATAPAEPGPMTFGPFPLPAGRTQLQLGSPTAAWLRPPEPFAAAIPAILQVTELRIQPGKTP
jgi:hypothetical protein